MNLFKLLENIECTHTLEDAEIKAVAGDSRLVKPGSLFVCMKGGSFDGHDVAADALNAGAAAVVCERDLGLSSQIVVGDTHRAYALICANFFDNPAKKLTMIGVTGTNGKTTCTYLIKQILEHVGKKTGLIGTIHTEIDSITLPAKHTTPDPLALHAMLARMVSAGCTHVVMEVSSHGLVQQRVAGTEFAAAVFTNLTQDHLDYHGDMENYYLAKKMLFNQSRIKIINADNEYGKRLCSELANPVRYSLVSDTADYTAKDLRLHPGGSEFFLLTDGLPIKMKIRQPGRFSVENAMAAAACCLELGVPVRDVAAALAASPGVEGRFEVIKPDGDYTVIRDYAHTPDGIEKILTAVRSLAPKRLVTLFGCAGNRDRTKRAKMGRLAAMHSDFVILTSDNPRSENPEQIADDAVVGVREVGTPFIKIVDRYDAIEWALENAREGDVIMLLGKGHEDYQVLDYGTIYFDEKIVVNEILAGKSKNENKGY